MSFHKDAKVDHEKQDVLQSASFNQVVSLQAPNVVTFPEGSTAGWLTVLGAALVLFSTFGISLSFGVLEDYYARVFLDKNTPSEISWIGSVQLLLDFSLGLPAGKLFDDGHFRLLMISGMIIYLSSFFLLSITQASHYYQVFLCQGVGMGIGMGFLIVPAVSLPSHYFREKRSLVTGITFAGSSMGGVIVPILLNHLINGRVGFAWGIRILAFMALVLLTIGNLLMKPRLPTKKHRAPEDTVSVKRIFRDVPYCLSICGSFLILLGLFFPYFYLQLFAVSHGIDERLAFYSITVLNAATVFGRIIPNFLADKYGPLNIAIVMTTISGGLVFAMLKVSSASGLFVFALFYGFFSGAFMSLLTAIMAAFSFSVNEIGSRIGIAMFVLAFAMLTGAPITGALIRPPQNTWWLAVLFSGVVMLSGVCVLVVSRKLFCKRKGTWRV